MDHRRTSLALGAGALLLLAGCQQTGPQRDGSAPSSALEDLRDEPDERVESPRSDGPSLAELARQSAIDLTEIQAQLDAQRGADGAMPADGERRPWQDRMDQPAQPQTPQNTPVVAPEEAAAASDDAQEDGPERPVDPFALLLERLEAESGDPRRGLAATLLAQAVREYTGMEDGARPGQDLSPAEREMVDALAPLLHALAAGDRADAPRRIGEAIDDVSRVLPDVLPIRINDAALATDIYGFAAYRPFERYAFQAGRTNRVLLYTEPAGFQSRLTTEPASRGQADNPGAYEVVLGLELRLYNERGSMLAWRKPEERVAIRSDRPRTEIYLGTVIDLPASLSVGRYQLKVIVRDQADGSEDERVIPIEIVADPNLTSRTTRSR
ncbi:MAG: hypothetical protein ACIAS6_07580 [Phycisphaerales bacterium JB060]